MNKITIFVIALAMVLVNCNDEKEIEPEVYVEPTLQDLDLSAGVASFAYSIGTQRALYKVDGSRVVTKVPFTFDGTLPNETQQSRFELWDINSPEYFIMKFDSLKQTYFVEKKTGKVYRTGDLDFNMLVSSSGNPINFQCTSRALYYTKTDGTIRRVENYLSPDAQIEPLPIKSDGGIFVDKDETIFARNANVLNLYSGGIVKPVLQGKSLSSMWIGIDGSFRAMDTNGIIYKVTADAVKQEGAIPITVAYVGAHNFPGLNKTVGVQMRFDMFHIIELTPPYKSVVSYNAPPPPQGESQEIHIKPLNGKLYIHTSARTRPQRLLTIDATDFKKSVDLPISNTDRAFYVLPLDNDFLLTSICVYDHFTCQEKLAFESPSGQVEFLFNEGSLYGKVIRL